MTRTEMNRFRAILTAKVAELERFTCHRDGIAVERSAEQFDEIEVASRRALEAVDGNVEEIQAPSGDLLRRAA
jgi:hypothetical protein